MERGADLRDKTTEQKVREAQVWEEIERERAKIRQLASLKQNQIPVVANLPQRVDYGKSRDIAALKVGMKARSYDKAKNVVKKADELRAEFVST